MTRLALELVGIITADLGAGFAGGIIVSCRTTSWASPRRAASLAVPPAKLTIVLAVGLATTRTNDMLHTSSGDAQPVRDTINSFLCLVFVVLEEDKFDPPRPRSFMLNKAATNAPAIAPPVLGCFTAAAIGVANVSSGDPRFSACARLHMQEMYPRVVDMDRHLRHRPHSRLETYLQNKKIQ